MESPHIKNGHEQLVLFEPDAALSILALHRYHCPEVPLEFLHPRLFNPNKPIPELHDDTFDHLKCEVFYLPTPAEDRAA
jgi:hypothetical protein